MADTGVTEEPPQPSSSFPRPEQASDSPPHPALDDMMENMIQEIRKMAVEAGKKETCLKDPNYDSDSPLTSGLSKLGLELESEIEALLATPLVTLPDDPDLLLGLATEGVAQAANHSARTLQYYRNRVEELHQKKRKYEDMVRKAASVNEALDKLLQEQRTEDERKVALERRNERLSLLFRCLRHELHVILETFDPDIVPDSDSVQSVENLLDALVSQMLQNPQDPYVDIVEAMDEKHITMLLCSNLITRHPSDLTRIRFVDPRV